MGRMIVKDAWGLYSEWLKEVEKITVMEEGMQTLVGEDKQEKAEAGKELALPVAQREEQALLPVASALEVKPMLAQANAEHASVPLLVGEEQRSCS